MNEIALWHQKQQILEQERLAYQFIEQVKKSPKPAIPSYEGFLSKANTASDTQSENHKILLQRFDNVVNNQEQTYRPKSIIRK